ncbi:MAG TPA: hypothetical protein PL106_14505, partial [Flavobacteriales bacterium]|nr:hypothetical protein [Flavobacteriales bacterium]
MRQLLTASIVLLATLATAQTKQAGARSSDQRRLEFTIKGLSKDTIYLAGYYGNKLLYNDTAVADAKGKVVFAKPRGYKAGVYAVVIPGPRYFEFLVNEPVVQMSSDTLDLGGALTVQKSPENQVFLDYIRFLNDKRKEADAMGKQRDAAEDPIR